MVAFPRMTVPIELDYDIIERDGPQDHLLLLIHGYGETPAPLVERLPLIDPTGRYLAVTPHAPFDKDGHPLWHRSLAKGTPAAQEQFAVSVVAIDHLLDVLEARTGLARAEAIVGGFSQGGGISVGLLRSPATVTPPAAVYGICTFVSAVPEHAQGRAPVTARPVLITGAAEDRFAPVEFARQSAQSLADDGYAVTFVEVPGEHTVTDASAAHVGTWLAQISTGQVPANL